MLCPTVFGLIAKITSKCILSVRLYKCKNESRKSHICTSRLQLSHSHSVSLFLERARAHSFLFHTYPHIHTHSVSIILLFFSHPFFLTNLIECISAHWCQLKPANLHKLGKGMNIRVLNNIINIYSIFNFDFASIYIYIYINLCG